jgi:hypothetical protein
MTFHFLRLIVASLVFGAATASAQTREQLKQQIYDLAVVIRSEISESTASNAELADAVQSLTEARDLILESGPGPGEGAIFSVSCDSVGNLRLELLTPSGRSQYEQYVGSQSSCQDQAARLSAISRVASYHVASICDSVGNLYLVRLEATPRIYEFAQTYAGSVQNCRVEAIRNTSIPAIVARPVGVFVCDSVGQLQGRFVTQASYAPFTDTYVGSRQQCGEQADVLAARRSTIRQFTLFGTCDSVGNLTRYSVDQTGRVQVIGEDYMGSYQTCLAEMRRISE